MFPRRRALIRYRADDGSLALVHVEQGGRGVVFGRWPKCEVSLASPCLSRRHFRIFWDGALLVVEDLGSSGGTFVNKQRAARAVLAPGDVIAWADIWVSVESVEVLSSLPGAPIPTTVGSSLLDKATLDRARAALWGQAIGDALGLATEFMTSDEARLAYPHGLSRYADIVRDDHRSRWPVGAFTDDTDQMLCILESLIACPTVDPVDIGGNIARWAATSGLGIGRTVQRALDRNGFNTDPIAAARQAWEDGRARHAANGAVMRTSVFGVWRLDDPAATPAVTLAAAAGCRVTHYDPRCVASCVAVSLAIRTLALDPQCDREGLFNSLADICLVRARGDLPAHRGDPSRFGGGRPGQRPPGFFGRRLVPWRVFLRARLFCCSVWPARTARAVVPPRDATYPGHGRGHFQHMVIRRCGYR